MPEARRRSDLAHLLQPAPPPHLSWWRRALAWCGAVVLKYMGAKG